DAGADLGPAIPFPGGHESQQPFALVLRQSGDQRTADRGGRQWNARAHVEPHHHGASRAAKFEIEEVEPVAAAERYGGAGLIGVKARRTSRPRASATTNLRSCSGTRPSTRPPAAWKLSYAAIPMDRCCKVPTVDRNTTTS